MRGRPYVTGVLRNPFREVTHIEIAQPGRNGAQPWILTLECGHLAFRSRGNTRDKLVHVARAMVRGIRFAPKRVRCFLCGEALREAKT